MVQKINKVMLPVVFVPRSDLFSLMNSLKWDWVLLHSGWTKAVSLNLAERHGWEEATQRSERHCSGKWEAADHPPSHIVLLWEDIHSFLAIPKPKMSGINSDSFLSLHHTSNMVGSLVDSTHQIYPYSNNFWPHLLLTLWSKPTLSLIFMSTWNPERGSSSSSTWTPR